MKMHKWADVRGQLTPEQEARNTARKDEMRKQMRLADLRRARGLTQQTLAASMKVAQAEVSKIEHRTDLYLSTLSNFVDAMNGQLVLVARFADGDVPLILSDEVLSEETIVPQAVRPAVRHLVARQAGKKFSRPTRGTKFASKRR